MKRVSVIGCCGAGKSVFSSRLAEITNLPLYHLDRIFWCAGWRAQEHELFLENMDAWLAQERWIIDGNYTRTLERRTQKADTIFFFDFPVWLCLYRILKRAVLYRGKTRPDMADGCKERFDLGFMLYVSRFQTETRPRILDALKNKPEGCEVVVFRRPFEVKAWLEKHYEQNWNNIYKIKRAKPQSTCDVCDGR